MLITLVYAVSSSIYSVTTLVLSQERLRICYRLLYARLAAGPLLQCSPTTHHSSGAYSLYSVLLAYSVYSVYSVSIVYSVYASVYVAAGPLI